MSKSTATARNLAIEIAAESEMLAAEYAANLAAQELKANMPTETLAIVAARADVAQIETALAGTPVTSVMHAVLAAALLTAADVLTAALASDASDTARLDAIDAAHAGVLALPESYRAAALATVLANIEKDYAPTAAPAETVAAPTVGKTLNPRTIERNNAVAADADTLALAAEYLAPFDRIDAADCLAHRDAGTRYPSFVALASAGPGVSDAGQYRTIATAVRLHMRSLGYAGVGNSVAETAWLARRNQYAPNGKKSGEYGGKCFHSGASIALYSDGKFRLAKPGTVGVRWLSTDAAAWAMFVGTAAAVQTTLADAPIQSGQLSMPLPTAPTLQASPLTGALTATEKCIRCNSSNLSTAQVCRTCKRYPRADDTASA